MIERVELRVLLSEVIAVEAWSKEELIVATLEVIPWAPDLADAKPDFKAS